MAKEIPVYISDKKLFASQLNATWQAIAEDTLLGIDPSDNKPKSLFNIGDLTEIVGGSMLNDVIVRNDGSINVYDSSAIAVGSTTWENLLSAGVSLLPKNFITGFLPEYDTSTTLKINGGTCRSSDDTTNLEVDDLGIKDLMQTWDEGFGSSIGCMVGAPTLVDNSTKMTAYNLPSGELAFATGSYNTTYAAWKSFYERYIYYTDFWGSDSSPTLPYYLGRQNNNGIIKGVSMTMPACSVFSGTTYRSDGPSSFDIVGTDDTITDQSSFDTANWTIIESFTDLTWDGFERKIFECQDNTTSYGWIGIKINGVQSGKSYVVVGKLNFLNSEAINELHELGSNEFKERISYHCFVLYNPISGDYDWCVDTDPEGGNILSNSAIVAAGYTKFRRVHSFTAKEGQIIREFTASESNHGAIDVVLNPNDTVEESILNWINSNNVQSHNTFNCLLYDISMPHGITGRSNAKMTFRSPTSAGAYVGVGDPNKYLPAWDLYYTSSYLSYLHYNYHPYYGTQPLRYLTKDGKACKFFNSGTTAYSYGYVAGYEDLRID